MDEMERVPRCDNEACLCRYDGDFIRCLDHEGYFDIAEGCPECRMSR